MVPPKNNNVLPVNEVLPQLLDCVSKTPVTILSAEPGAGKTTRVPLALLQSQGSTDQKIIMLEPRRLPTRRSAEYIAGLLNENVGRTVGYTIRGERCTGSHTRLEIVTEGVLTRMIQDDPALSGIGMLIFDEFHERSIHADLGLAFALDVQQHLRPDLKIIIMSATLDVESLSVMLAGATVISSTGRTFPVLTHYLSGSGDTTLEQRILSAVRKALVNDQGDVLVFLPGQREIRRVETMICDANFPEEVVVHSLFGEAPFQQQLAALSPDPRQRRKIILSTNIAETSLTIDGVSVVIDSGLARVSEFDPRRGMTGLVTTTISQGNADQRRGRAGRQQPGVCYRLWSEADHTLLPKFLPPEIRSADLAPLALELARWGSPDGNNLRFLDPPPVHHLQQARTLLTELGALDRKGNLTSHGSRMTALPVHPRLAHMLIRGKELGLGKLACEVAALLEERDLLRGASDSDIDLYSRWYTLRHKKGGNKSLIERAHQQVIRLQRILDVSDSKGDESRLGILLALAYPEKVAKRREEDSSRYQMVSGTGAVLPKSSMLNREQFLAVADVDGIGSEVKIFLASPLSEHDIELAFGDQVEEFEEARWDERSETVIARRVKKLGALELAESKIKAPVATLRSGMIEGIRKMGLDVLPWSKDALSIRTRSEWLRKQECGRDEWIDLSDEHLLETLEEWLGPYLTGIANRQQLERLPMTEIIKGMFTYKQLRELDELAPTHLVVPTGSRIPLDYSSGEKPILAVRLQEMFGQTDTPTVARGRVKVLIHLLSPAHRPLAVTQDLPSFWKNAYADVRKDMRGRYPKHHWPENPLEAEPTKRTKRRDQ